jgi:hypothetical protein
MQNMQEYNSILPQIQEKMVTNNQSLVQLQHNRPIITATLFTCV